MAFDVVLFLPGGAIMDRFGRWWVCVPTMFALAVCMLVLPFTTTYLQVGIVAVLLGIGNGVSSGIAAITFREAARASIGSNMPAKSLELKHTIQLILELGSEIETSATNCAAARCW